MVRTTLSRPARLALRLLAVSGVALATANCATNPQQQKLSPGNGIDPKYGVKASPRLYNEGDVIPKGGGRRYTGKPYVVAGQTYVPKEDPRGYVREGLASWYGSAFHGRMTANGEVFDRHSIAAAHPTLPLPSYARVTNLDNGSSMIVRVNDRGPYHAGRVMDVSEEAAEALGFHRRGTAHVRVEYAGRASVAGSDDRKLLASLRTDGQPAGRSTVMMADLGPSEEPERYARSAPEPLAFKPAPERAQTDEAPAPRPAPVRAPIVLASAAMRVPAAVQPTAQKVRDFRPAPVQVAEHKSAEHRGAGVKVAGLNPASGQGLAQASGHGAAPKPTAVALRAAPGPGRPGAPAKFAAAAPAALLPASKSALAHLASAAAPAKEPARGLAAIPAKAAASAKGTAPTKVATAAKAPAQAKAGSPTKTASAGAGHARLAGIY
ncbi:septal ring lytic transglycosylase RlpA family protein [Methylobacterium sp. J-077]|uniref:septal ring lytic transglycosylase RlpA family protein n=1 Tax=Methylobacterium sp. J-077 TaxID=2836656 RepID=UPI001FBB9BBF|nr:septal ring lytic transglycosylase RlpA family protein [Methylobacterium sp. J-077]MCJ2122888.1 septal ring lytic transglycosylase RlpA family protein [Methylobacterium sp. J-077]